MTEPQILAAYDATDEAADGLALAHLLAERLDRPLVVARVFTGGGAPEVTDRTRQLSIRESMQATRRALLAAVPDAAGAELTPVVDASVARGLHELARTEAAEAIVVGSSHRHGVGRVLLGGSPELVVDGAPCPVVVAPAGFHEQPRLAPEVVAVAYDGTPAADVALAHACELARRLGMALRVITVRPPWMERPAGVPHDVEAIQARAQELVAATEGGAPELQLALRAGHPATEIVAEARGSAGLLVVGSRRRGALRRALLGSVSTGVLRHAPVPVVVATT